MLALLLLLQTVSGPPPEEPLPAVTAKARDCRAEADEIIVCKSPDGDRLKPLPERPAEAVLPDAGARIGRNKTIRSRAEPSGNPFVSGPRLMTGVTIEF